MGGATDILMVMLLLAGGYVLIKSGKLEDLLGGNIKLPALPGIPGLPGPLGESPAPPEGGAPEGGGGGEAAPAAPGGGGTMSTGTGDCAKSMYPGTGQVKDNSKRTKQGTRHYRSGKPDDVTSEWGTTVSFKNYEFTCYLTVTKIDHDDTVSMKYGGTHMGSGWFDSGISFEGGETCLGAEKSHPDTDLCIVKGKSFGSIVNKKIGLKCVLFDAGGSSPNLEIWCDPTATGKWELGAKSAGGVGGWKPSSAEQECTIRIDGAPGITMHCSAVHEINPGGGGAGGAPAPAGGGAAPAPAAPAAEPAEAEGGGGGGGEDEGGGGGGGGGGESESNYSRVNRRSYSSRVRYY